MTLKEHSNIVEGKIRRQEKVFWMLAFLFLFIAYLSHLGHIPLDVETDEARRALVSMEMMITHDYITPTLNGELYLNKPPVYNWLIILFVKLFGNFSVFAFRLPVIISLALMGGVVYWVTKKYTTQVIALFTAFAFCTNGRVFIYDSFQGLIDTTFSLMVYLNFAAIFWFGEKKKFWHLFLTTYLFTALGFLTKGMPMLVFQSISLLTWFILNKQFKKLFHPAHFVGIGILLLVAGGYYALYFSLNDITPLQLFSNLLNESTKRTPLQHETTRSFFHLFTFPPWLLFQFAPWTIFVVALFQKNLLNKLKENRFIHFSAWMFIANITVYWLSPEVHPRYLFMFLPWMYLVFFYMYFTHTNEGQWQRRTVSAFVLFVCVALFAASLALPFIRATEKIHHAGTKGAVLSLLLLLTCYVAIKYKAKRLHAFVVVMIITRIGFNLFVIDQRGSRFFKAEATAVTIAQLTKGEKLFLLRHAQIGNFDGMSFHISKRKNEILRFKETAEHGPFFIADVKQLKEMQYTSYLEFFNYSSDTLRLVKFR